jgi:transglutaminase-like putative cysteine protease
VIWGLLAITVAATLATFRTLLGAEAGVAFVVLLLALKTLEMRAQRDAMVLFFLGFFTLLTLFFQSQSLPTALAMLLGLWGLLAALVNAHLPVGKPTLRLCLATAAKLMLWGAPCMLVLFLFFPRLPPLWGVPSDPTRAKTGLSSQMEVGNIAQLAQDPSVAMRLRFLTPLAQAPHPTRLYFRGPVLSQFDGKQWSALPEWSRSSPPTASSDSAPQALGEGLAYEMTLQPHRQRWLVTPDATLRPPELEGQRASAAGPLQWQSQRPINDVLRYRAVMHLDYRWAGSLSPQAAQQATQLPPASDPRTRTWGEQLRKHYPEQPAAIVAEVLHHLRQGGYRYTLEPSTIARDTADDFWFDQKAGFCEHMASAFVVLMRAAGVPARVVTGYQGGERNAVDGLWTVRQRDAHAWAEVWLPNDGWTRVDPTAAVAPGRLGEQQRLLPPPTLLGNAIDSMVGVAQLHRLRANWEALNYRWNDWVLGYSVRQQSSALQWLHTLWQAHSGQLMAGIATVVVVAWGLWRWRRNGAGRDPWTVLLAQSRQRLHTHGIPTAPHMGTQALAQAAIAQWGVGAVALQGWLERMERYRYGPAASGTPSLRDLRREFRSLRWPPARM